VQESYADRRAILRMFLDAGFDTTFVDDSGMTLLMWAIRSAGMSDYAARAFCSDIIDHVLWLPHMSVRRSDNDAGSPISPRRSVSDGSSDRKRHRSNQ
jgi:hypothetical protein